MSSKKKTFVSGPKQRPHWRTTKSSSKPRSSPTMPNMAGIGDGTVHPLSAAVENQGSLGRLGIETEVNYKGGEWELVDDSEDKEN